MSDLRRLYREMADSGVLFYGLSIVQHAPQIGALVRSTGAKTLLDYGSGRGDAYRRPFEIHKAWGVDKPVLYDPAFPEHDVLPPSGFQFDGVLCSDVLEHVPETEVEAFVDELFALSRGFVWASVCCRPAKKFFPDGTNLHVTLKPLEWWRRVFDNASCGTDWVLVETP